VVSGAASAGAGEGAEPAEASSEADLRLVLCNAPPDQAEAIARAVLEKRLAACVNIVPGVVSLYWWQGALCRDAESTLLIKTRADLIGPLTEAIRAAHSYEVPEVIALPLQRGEGNAAYAAWVRAETGASRGGLGSAGG
jgi:periplasmic divalent cation tolerance protein